MEAALPVYTNGPFGVGLSGGKDMLAKTEDKMVLPAAYAHDADEAVKRAFAAYAISRLHIPVGWDDISKAVLVKGVYFVIGCDIVDRGIINVIRSDIVPVVAAVTEAEVTRLFRIGVTYDNIATIIASGKLTWWTTNHHVGTTSGKIAGHSGKAVSVLGWLNCEGIKDAIWRVGHYADTKKVLKVLNLGVGHHPTRDHVPGWIGTDEFDVHEDMVMRASATPSGTAKVITYHEIRKQARNLPYGLIITIETQFATIEETIAKIRQNPCAYHSGADYLIGAPKLVAVGYSDVDMLALSCYIYAIRAGSSFARSGILVDKATCEAEPLYSWLCSIKLALLAGATNELVMRIAREKGYAVGGVAVSDNIIAAEVVQETADRMTQEEEAKKAADEQALVVVPAKASSKRTPPLRIGPPSKKATGGGGGEGAP